VLVLIHFHHENIRAHVHENIWTAPGAPVCDALVKRDREIGITRANEVSDGSLFRFMVPHYGVVGVGVDKTPVAVAFVGFDGGYCAAEWSNAAG
jgi:hypothetical protein